MARLYYGPGPQGRALQPLRQSGHIGGMSDRVATYRPTLDEVKGGVDWSIAERMVLAACREDRLIRVGDERPKEAADKNRVRAGLIRFLLLGGDGDKVVPHPKGVMIAGAWIGGQLDFDGCATTLNLRLSICCFEKAPTLRSSSIGNLNLDGSSLPGLILYRATCSGGVFLRNGFISSEEINLNEAKVTYTLTCKNGIIDTKKEIALNCNWATFGSGVILSDGFVCRGSASFIGAEICGQLNFSGGSFFAKSLLAINCALACVTGNVTIGSNDTSGSTHKTSIYGNVNFTSLSVNNDLDFRNCTVNGELHLTAAKIGGRLFWTNISDPVQAFLLKGTYVRELRDDLKSWDLVESLHLSGFEYDNLDGGMTVQQRLKWLRKKQELRIEPAVSEPVFVAAMNRLVRKPLAWLRGPCRPDFDPQPYTQLAKVLTARGDRLGAARVNYDREHRQRLAEGHRAHAALDGNFKPAVISVAMDLRRIWNFFFRWVFGYGHLPTRSLIWAFVIWAATALLFGKIYDAGQMAPNSDVILTSPDWIAAVDAYDACSTDCIMPLQRWTGIQGQIDPAPSAIDYETFSRGLYALDLFLPLDSLAQQEAWAPSKDRGNWGWAGFYLRFVIQLSGWLIAAVGAAVVTGLVGRRNE